MKNILLIISSFILIVSCNPSVDNVNEVEHQHFVLKGEMKKNTDISEVKEEPISEQLTLTGKIEYDQNDLVTFKSLLTGVVESVKFELGDFVKKGHILAVVRSNDMIELTQKKQLFENQEKLLEKQFKTKKDLLDDGLTTLPELNQLESELQEAKIEVQKIKETLSLYSAGSASGTYYIVAPKDGYIVQKDISVGMPITSESDPLFSISNLKEVWVMVNIYANNLKYIKEGSDVKVRTIAYPDVFYNGKIDKIYNVFDDNEHVLKARVVLKNQNLNLLPGLSVDIFINKHTSNSMAIAIPHKAVIFSNDKNYVVVYNDDNHLEIRKIDPVAENELFIYTKDGLKAGDKVVTKNALLIYEELIK